MFWVYVLFSTKDKHLYVGCTSDLKRRLERHVNGYVPATKHRRPLVLIHSEEYEEKAKAFQRERFWKSLWGAREKKKILEHYMDANRGYSIV
jgi:putative endonuclease